MSMASHEGRRISAPLAGRVGDDASAAQIAEAVLVMWNEIDDALTPVLGARGLVALYRRSLHLTSAACPGIADGADGLLQAAEPALLRSLLAGQSAAQAATLGRAFLVQFNRLVTSLIGPSLTARLLRAVWLHPLSGPAAQDPLSQANVALPLCLIPAGDGRLWPASGRSQANVALPLCLIPAGDGRPRPALGRS